jgi:hypothetical protein
VARTNHSYQTVADVLADWDVDPRRIRLRPAPGTATEKDLLKLLDHNDRLYELVDSTLIEKTNGFLESHVAVQIAYLIQDHLQTHDL